MGNEKTKILKEFQNKVACSVVGIRRPTEYGLLDLGAFTHISN